MRRDDALSQSAGSRITDEAVGQGRASTRDLELGAMVALAAALQIAESFLPYPVPGMKLGLANLGTLLALARWGTGAALTVAFLRTIVASLLLGTFLAPPFLLSLTGAVASALASSAPAWAGARRPTPLFSLAGLGALGACASVLGQAFVAAFVFVKSPAVLGLLPWLLISGVLAGFAGGLIASRLLSSGWMERRLGDFTPGSSREAFRGKCDPRVDPIAPGPETSRSKETPLRHPQASEGLPSWARKSTLRNRAVLLLALSAAAWASLAPSFPWMVVPIALIVLVSAAAGLPLKKVWRVIRRASLPIAVFALLAFLSGNDGEVWKTFWGYPVCVDGLRLAGLAALRLLFLSLNASALMHALPGAVLVDTFVTLTPPWPPLRRSARRFGRIAREALEAVPAMVGELKNLFREKGAAWLSALIPSRFRRRMPGEKIAPGTGTHR